MLQLRATERVPHRSCWSAQPSSGASSELADAVEASHRGPRRPPGAGPQRRATELVAAFVTMAELERRLAAGGTELRSDRGGVPPGRAQPGRRHRRAPRDDPSAPTGGSPRHDCIARLPEVVLCGGKRTPFGDFGQSLKDIPGPDLGIHAACGHPRRTRPRRPSTSTTSSAATSCPSTRAATSPAGSSPSAVGLPEESGALDVSRACGSGTQAIVSATPSRS